MKLKMASLVFLSIFCMNVLAATPPVVNRYVDSFMIHMKAKVTLTDDQTSDLANILYNGINDREDVIDSYAGKHSLMDKRSMKTELEAINDQTTAEAREILDDKQFAVFKEIQAENQAKVKARLQR